MTEKNRASARIAILAEGDNRAVFPLENVSFPLHAEL
jgi:hypothetical protein